MNGCGSCTKGVGNNLWHYQITRKNNYREKTELRTERYCDVWTQKWTLKPGDKEEKAPGTFICLLPNNCETAGDCLDDGHAEGLSETGVEKNIA
jgi:hypothetical protein